MKCDKPSAPTVYRMVVRRLDGGTRPSAWEHMAVADLRSTCRQTTKVRGLARMKKADLIAVLEEATVRDESNRVMVHVILHDIIHRVVVECDEVAVSEPTGALYEVERVLGTRWVDGQAFLHIRWKGFGPADDTWEPSTHYALLDADEGHRLAPTPSSHPRRTTPSNDACARVIVP